MTTRSTAGFTLVEVLVVTVVIGILASISFVSFSGALDRAKQRATMSDMRTISRALEAYSVDNSILPDDSGGLNALLDDLIPYSTDVLPLLDHWGNAYSYDVTVDDYTLESFGKDGVEGADLTPDSELDFTRDIVIYNGVFTASPG
jgi:general secretion pathway protein G